MFIRNFIAAFVFCSSGFTLLSQTIDPQVINSAGDIRLRSDGVSLLDNVGEPFTQSIAGGESLITQGFIQNYNFFSVLKGDETCFKKEDGTISILTNSIDYPVSGIKYLWLPPGTCPSDTCSRLKNLKPNTYTVSIVVTSQAANTATTTLAPVTILASNNECKIKVYNAVTVNDDYINEVFIIENISEFPNNRVSIYNRWGTLIFEAPNYDNVKVFWPNKENLNTLASSTYFYIIELGDGSAPLKGWVELFKN